MRFEVTVPASPARREIVQTFKAESEQAARAVIRVWLGHDAAMQAIVRAVPETLESVVVGKGKE